MPELNVTRSTRSFIFPFLCNFKKFQGSSFWGSNSRLQFSLKGILLMPFSTSSTFPKLPKTRSSWSICFVVSSKTYLGNQSRSNCKVVGSTFNFLSVKFIASNNFSDGVIDVTLIDFSWKKKPSDGFFAETYSRTQAFKSHPKFLSSLFFIVKDKRSLFCYNKISTSFIFFMFHLHSSRSFSSVLVIVFSSEVFNSVQASKTSSLGWKFSYLKTSLKASVSFCSLKLRVQNFSILDSNVSFRWSACSNLIANTFVFSHHCLSNFHPIKSTTSTEFSCLHVVTKIFSHGFFSFFKSFSMIRQSLFKWPL